MAVSRNPQENLARAVAKIDEAGRNGAQVVCLPELFQSQYFCQREDTANFDLAEAVPGPTTEALGRVELLAPDGGIPQSALGRLLLGLEARRRAVGGRRPPIRREREGRAETDPPKAAPW